MTKLLASGENNLLLLYVAIGIVGVAILVATVACAIIQAMIYIKYHNLNRQPTAQGLTATQAARALLDANGMQDVKVAKLKWYQVLIFGNHYSVKHKTIFLRKNLVNSTSITAVGVGLQKVGLAIMDKNGDRKIKVRSIAMPFVFLAPVLFIPIVIVGFVIDFFLGLTGLPTLIAAIVGVVFFGLALLYQILDIPVQKKANAIALEVMEKSNFLTPEEREKCAQLFKLYITKSIVDFVISILEILYEVLKIVLNVLKKKEK